MSWQEGTLYLVDRFSVAPKRKAALRCWSGLFTPPAAWEQLQSDGILYGPGPDLVAEQWQGYDWRWRTVYEWMAEQMEKRIGKRPRPGIYPLWGWYQWKDATHRRPDLRSRQLARGTRGVRLACEIPTEQILLSDFNQWYSALLYWYCSLSEAEDDAFEAELALHGLTRGLVSEGPYSDAVYHQRILDSWERIFDLDSVGDPDWLGRKTKDEKSIQGTFWQLSLAQVRAFSTFTSR